MVIPHKHSVACWTIEPSRVTGAAAPANGIETICAGTPARPRSIRLREANSVHINGGEGQTSNTARGLAANSRWPPETAANMSIITWVVWEENGPVTMGLLE